MGKNNTELLKTAEQYLGDGGAIFRKFCGLPSDAAWCSAFVSYIFNKGDDASLFYGGKRVAYCPYAKAWCDNNLANIPIFLAMPMDIVLFDWNPGTMPDHIGFAVERISDQELRTIEGNTNNSVVAYKKRVAPYICGCYRPHFKPASFSKTKKLEVDGAFGYNSIAILQKWLGVTQDAVLKKSDIEALQKKIGVTQDGSWGTNTSKALQKLIGVQADGNFGVESVKALQQYLNTNAFKETANKKAVNKNANNIVAFAKGYCWAYKTEKKKWDYQTGNPTTAYDKATKGKRRITKSDCGYFVSKVLKKALKVSYNPLEWKKKVPSKLKLVHQGKAIPKGFLQAGDIVAYKTTTGQHTLIYMGDGLIAEAGRKRRFPVIRKSTKYNASTVKKKTIKVYRAK